MVKIVVAIIGFGLFIASVVRLVIMAENESFGLAFMFGACAILIAVARLWGDAGDRAAPHGALSGAVQVSHV